MVSLDDQLTRACRLQNGSCAEYDEVGSSVFVLCCFVSHKGADWRREAIRKLEMQALAVEGGQLLLSKVQKVNCLEWSDAPNRKRRD